MFPLENPFILAPMAGITDLPFRRLIRKMGAGCVVTEFVSAHAIAYGGPRVERYLAYHAEERPVGLQIFGGDDDILEIASQKAQDLGFDFLDINLGCPVPKVTRKGGGSAWLCMPTELGTMLSRIRKTLTIPFTIKIRTGWDAQTINANEIVRIARESGVDAVAIHGRTRAQGYSGVANWDLISEIAQNQKMPIIGNGDLITGPQAAARFLVSGCKGVMVGRGALKNPWIFLEASEALEQLLKIPEAIRLKVAHEILEKFNVADEAKKKAEENYYVRKIKKTQPKPIDETAGVVGIRADRNASLLLDLHLKFLREFYPESRVTFGFRKFLAWYSAGYPGSHVFRKFIFTNEHFDQIYEESLRFFDSIKALGTHADSQREEAPVLMSGHG